MERLSLSFVIFVLTLLSTFSLSSSTEETSKVRQSGKWVGKGSKAAKIELSDPKGGWTQDRMLLVAGMVSDQTINPITVSINGDKYLLRTYSGSFKRKFPITQGKNSIVVSGTNKAGMTKMERTVYANISPVALMTVLTSDTDGVYTDLHIYEPSPDVSDPISEGENSNVHMFWARTNSPSGGKFYLNEQGGDYDSPGYGPYLYTHTSPPLGIYRIDTNYWPSGDKAHTVGVLNVVLFGGTPNEIRRTVKQPLVTPGETLTLAWVRIDKAQVGYIYCPLLDEKPKDQKVWPKWVLDRNPRQQGTPDGSFEG